MNSKQEFYRLFVNDSTSAILFPFLRSCFLTFRKFLTAIPIFICKGNPNLMIVKDRPFQQLSVCWLALFTNRIKKRFFFFFLLEVKKGNPKYDIHFCRLWQSQKFLMTSMTELRTWADGKIGKKLKTRTKSTFPAAKIPFLYEFPVEEFKPTKRRHDGSFWKPWNKATGRNLIYLNRDGDDEGSFDGNKTERRRTGFNRQAKEFKNNLGYVSADQNQVLFVKIARLDRSYVIIYFVACSADACPPAQT